MKPLVSAVIPCYNGEKYILEAIQSILDQTYDNINIIIVDDGSTDRTVSIIKELSEYEELKLIQHDENRGIAGSRNTGIEHASGKYVAMLDQDDRWMSHRVETMVNFLEDHNSVGMAISNFIVIDESGEVTGERVFPDDLINWTTQEIAKFMLYDHWKYNQPHLPLTSDFVRKSAFDEVGLYDEDLFGYNDQDFLLRLSRSYNVKLFTEPLMYKRDHNENVVKNSRKMMNDKFYFYKSIAENNPELKQYSKESLARLCLRESKRNFEEKNMVDFLLNLFKSFMYSSKTATKQLYTYIK